MPAIVAVGRSDERLYLYMSVRITQSVIICLSGSRAPKMGDDRRLSGEHS